MLAAQRQSEILERVRRTGSVRVAELATELAVSEMTIRRDLDALDERGLLSKVHGGATAAGPGATHEPGFAAKSVRQQAEKATIAQRAASLVRPGTAVALSAGTTTAGLAGLLRDVPDLTVVTNSIPVADALRRDNPADADSALLESGPQVVLTGGVRTRSDALVGPIAVAAIGSLHCDVLFLGVHGMSQRAGFTTPNLMEAETNRALVASAGRLVVLADHTKWDTVGISTMAALREADVLITDSGLPDAARDILAGEVGELIIVEAPAA
ncbi:DeoR/GlpR family DNA-binding transcription regulator [Luedemannella helvata]|uniref:DeoR/GlpR family DNA-binding transcription regulator n=1 Tax=Luedemannella helvata TaxID=349315 RepID=A0ABN2JQ50_9ACTN